MRRVARVDSNHAEIVKALRQYGCSVQSLAAVGQGCPDLAVGRRLCNLLLEVKDGSKPPSSTRLTTEEINWHASWRGLVVTVYTVEEALEYVSRNA
jgi:Holliday junction resolvase